MNDILELVSILVINANADFIYQWPGDENVHPIYVESTYEAQEIIRDHLPNVIIAHVDCDTMETFFGGIGFHPSLTNRPILIIVTDTPSINHFTVADQIVATSQLPHIWPIVQKWLMHAQREAQIKKQYVELGVQNQELRAQIQQVTHATKEINVLKQSIIQGVSHELRTPMLQVKSAVALLSEDEGTNRTIIDLAMGAITRLESGIWSITLLNELMNERPDNEAFTVVPVTQIFDAALRNLGKSWEHRQQIYRIKMHIAAESSAISCDRPRIITAIQLLLDNALKFSTAEVELVATEDQGSITISVEDRGIGIPQDQLERIFDAFYQIDGSSTRRYGGMGIGLAIVNLILEQHKTSIFIRSVQGKGSTFAFKLPKLT